MRRFSNPALLVSLAIVMAILVYAWTMRGTETGIQQAEEKYTAGEKAASIAERAQDFNEALKIYLTLEESYHPTFGNGRLYYDIGNTYFQLGEYPLAILYYNRAKELMLRDERVIHNLQAASNKLALPKQLASNPFASVFFFHTYLSLPERLQLFFGLALTALIFASLYIWVHSKWLRNIAIFAVSLAGVMLLSVGFTHYFSPVEAVMIKSANMRRDAGNQYAKVSDQPIPAGTKVEVLGSTSDGLWYKVSTSNKDFGYVPQETIRLI